MMGPLNQQLSALRSEKEAARDPAATAIMNRAIEEHRASGALDRVRRVGTTAPLFARPNLDGATVHLRSLVKRGPVVVSFFRGRW